MAETWWSSNAFFSSKLNRINSSFEPFSPKLNRLNSSSEPFSPKLNRLNSSFEPSPVHEHQQFETLEKQEYQFLGIDTGEKSKKN